MNGWYGTTPAHWPAELQDNTRYGLLSDQYWLDLTDSLIKDIETMLGNELVVTRCTPPKVPVEQISFWDSPGQRYEARVFPFNLSSKSSELTEILYTATISKEIKVDQVHSYQPNGKS